MKGLSREKFHLSAESSRQLVTQHTRSCSMLITTPLVDRFLQSLYEPDLNSLCRGSVLKTANHGSICDSSPAGAGPMAISGYAWGHIVATGPQQLRPGHQLP
jgi:hypothetical protein